MKLSDYSYDLPDRLIAINPPVIRGESRLLFFNRSSKSVLDKNYADIVDILQPGDLLVLNDTRVIKARLKTIKASGATCELVVLEKHSFDNDWHRHRVLYRRKLKQGDILKIDQATLVVEEIQGDGLALIKSDCNLLELAEAKGEVPLPPYMHRDATPLDIERYQTIWAKEKGSVAAPTASLNMTNKTLDALMQKGVQVAHLTLHVGLGTFLPIRTDDIESHHMHQEYFEIPVETVKAIQTAKLNGKKVIALGTTVARTLEFNHNLLTQPPINLSGEADIFIYPGYDFKSIDGLLTNFHAPKSTVLMLTAAFAGWDNLISLYNHAIEDEYSFLSYGDSMLIL